MKNILTKVIEWVKKTGNNRRKLMVLLGLVMLLDFLVWLVYNQLFLSKYNEQLLWVVKYFFYPMRYLRVMETLLVFGLLRLKMEVSNLNRVFQWLIIVFVLLLFNNLSSSFILFASRLALLNPITYHFWIYSLLTELFVPITLLFRYSGPLSDALRFYTGADQLVGLMILVGPTVLLIRSIIANRKAPATGSEQPPLKERSGIVVHVVVYQLVMYIGALGVILMTDMIPLNAYAAEDQKTGVVYLVIFILLFGLIFRFGHRGMKKTRKKASEHVLYNVDFFNTAVSVIIFVVLLLSSYGLFVTPQNYPDYSPAYKAAVAWIYIANALLMGLNVFRIQLRKRTTPVLNEEVVVMNENE